MTDITDGHKLLDAADVCSLPAVGSSSITFSIHNLLRRPLEPLFRWKMSRINFAVTSYNHLHTDQGQVYNFSCIAKSIVDRGNHMLATSMTPGTASDVPEW